MYRPPFMSLKDFYKVGHPPMFVPGTNFTYSNFCPRASRVEGVDYMIWLGKQYLIKSYLIDLANETFFNQPKDKVVNQYKRRCDNGLGPILDFQHIADLHDLGYLPLLIKSLPEGTKVPLGVPAMTGQSTHGEFPWITNSIESMSSSILWKPSTSATTAQVIRKKLNDYAEQCGGDIIIPGLEVPFTSLQGHDFSYRGMSGTEDAMMSGAGHLSSFIGTDTVPALDFLEEIYNANSDQEILGLSVPASEHSIMCQLGPDGEFELVKYLLEKHPTGILSLVADTWSLWHFIVNHMAHLKDSIMNRDGKLVVRPDTGMPNLIMNGDPNATEECEKKGVLRLLEEIFGSSHVGDKGFKLLDPHVGAIYGDSIGLHNIDSILQGMMANKFHIANCVFGLGSYTYEYVTRDTYGTVCKGTYIEIDGVGRDLFKNPVTGAWKKSHKGLLAVHEDDNGRLYVKEQCTREEEQQGLLQPAFLNGTLLMDENWSDIRKRIAAYH